MIEQTIDRGLVTVHHVEATVGKTGLLQQLGDEHRRRRILLGRLEHERVAARESVGEHPHGHHGREVERRDAGHHTERLADVVHVDSGRSLLGVATLHQIGNTARELDVLETARHFAERIRQHLAVFLGEEAGDLLAIGRHQLAHMEHDLGATRQVGGTPGRQRGLGDRDGVVDLGDVGETDLTLHLSGGGVVDLAGASGLAGHGAAVDPMVDAIHVVLFLVARARGDQTRYCERPRLTYCPWPLRPT